MEAETGRKRRRRRRIVAVVLGILFLNSLYLGGLDLYRTAQKRSDPLVKNPDVAEDSDHLETLVRAVSIDPTRGDLVLRVEIRPFGRLAGPNGITMTHPVHVDAAGETGNFSRRHGPGDHIAPFDVTIGLVGDHNSYPLDSYRGRFVVRAIALSPSTSEQGDPIAAFPTQSAFDGTLSGYRIKAKSFDARGAEQTPDPNALFLDLSVERARVTIAFAVLMLVLQLLLAAAAVTLAAYVWKSRRLMEFPMLTWMAALLFAIVPLRNAMPGAPPIGAQADVLVFFWAATLIALSLVSLLMTWIRRPPPKPDR